MISLVKIKRGNTVDIEILCVDKNDQAITNLFSYTSSQFQVKKRKKQALPDIRALTVGIPGTPLMWLNSPSLGWVTVSIPASYTEIDIGVYYMALQLMIPPGPTPGSGDSYECRMLVEGIETDRLEIVQDIIQ